MQTETENIIGLLRLMNTDQVSSAEDKLFSMVQEVTFLDKIFEIIKSPQLQPWLKTIAATFMNKVMSQKLQQFGYKSMFMAMSRIMSSYQVASSDKRCFESSIITLIEYIKQPEEIQQWRQFILSHVNDYKLFDTALLLIDCTAIAQIQSDYLCMIIEDTFQLTLSMCTQVTLQNAMHCNQLIKCWIVVIDKLSQITNQQSVDVLMVKICTSRTLAKFLFKIFEFNSPQEIWLCVNHQLFELNLLKYEGAELIRKVSQYSLKNSLPVQQCHCIQLIVQSYQKIKNTIAIVSVSNNLEIMETLQCEDFVTSMIGLLIIYIKASQQNTVNEDEMYILQHIAGYPFIKTREEQLISFEQSPSEFNTLAEDMCDKQTFGILKTQAARLLETIADLIKTNLQKSISFCIQCIKMSIGYIPKYEQSDIKILDLETAFQILTVYSFSLEKYPTMLQHLKVILCDKRIMELEPLSLARIFMFLAYNYEEVFKNPQQGAFWIDFALGYNKHPTTRYMALDFVSNVVDEYFSQSLYNQLIHLILSAKPTESGLVWNIIRKLFASQKTKISEQNCLLLVNTVFKRIQMQFHLLQSKEKQSTQDVINAIHILRRILQDKEYLLNKQSLKMRILDITVIYSKTIALDLDDEVIKILTEYANNYLTLAKEKILALLNPILEQFKKDEYYQNSYFIFFNQLIIGFTFDQIKPILKTLLSGLMFHLFDMSESAKNRKMKIAIANTLTILQNLLSVHGYQMSGSHDDCMCQIGAMCIRLFPSQQGQKIFSKPLLAKAMNLMFLCHLYSKTQNTIQYLFKFSKQNIFNGYDAYMLVKLLSKAIFAEQNVHIVIEYLNLMINVTNEYEKNQKKTKSVKTANGKLKIKREEQFSNLLFQITSPFINFEYTKTKKQLPIKQQIVESITKMKNNNIDTYKLIVMNMNQEQKTKLTNLLNQKVEVEGKNRVIRKIVGVKSIPNNEANNNENSDMEQNDEQDETNFKRKRVLLKKNQNKKKKEGNSINVE